MSFISNPSSRVWSESKIPPLFIFPGHKRIGDTITARAEVAEKIPEKNIVVFKCEWTNQRGEIVIEGTVKVMPPKK